MDRNEIEALKAKIEQLEARLGEEPEADDDDVDIDDDYIGDDEDDEDDNDDGVEKGFVEAVVDGDEFIGLILKAVGDAAAGMQASVDAVMAEVGGLRKAMADIAEGQETLSKALAALPEAAEMVKALQAETDRRAQVTPAPHVPSGQPARTVVEKPGGNGTGPDKTLLMKASQLFGKSLELRRAGADIPEINGADLDYGNVTNDQLTAFVKAVEAAS